MTPDTPSPITPPPPGSDIFATTRWTVVLAAGARTSPQSAQALEELCRIYWYPLYAYVRRQGHSREDAEDLTQGFFARLLARHDLGGLAAERGKFRAFLLAALKHFLANERARARASKRGGGQSPLSLDWPGANTRYELTPLEAPTPDRLFDREWATALLGRVLERMSAEFAAAGRADFFAQVKATLTLDAGGIAYPQVAAATGLTDGALRVAIHRLRRRYRQLLREEVAQTLAEPRGVDEELRSLFAAFCG